MIDEKYKQIINLPHHISKNHKQMSLYDRAAQFAPFSALNGYEDAIDENSHDYDNIIELDENALEKINIKLNILNDLKENAGIIKIKYYKNFKKNLGNYLEIESRILNIDLINKKIILENKIEIDIKDIISIEGKIFDSFEI